MDTRRMAWLLAGVVEADVEGLRGGTVPFPAQGGRADGGFEEQALTSEEDKGLVLDPTRLTMRETLAKNLATRKRAASFLHQVLLMVRSAASVAVGRKTPIMLILRACKLLILEIARTFVHLVYIFIASGSTILLYNASSNMSRS